MSLYGLLTGVAAIAGFTAMVGAFAFVSRMEARVPAALGEKVGGHKAVRRKLRRRLPLNQDEIAYAQEMVSECRSPLAYCIPAFLFSMGCLYIFGCLQQLHGAAPSFRTFIGFFPMLGSMNLTGQLSRVARLKTPLQEAIAQQAADSGALVSR